MKREYVVSSMIRSIGYDSTSCILEVESNSGDVWQYSEFPQCLWYEFKSAGSKGKFFHSNIKFEYTQKGHKVR